VKKSETESAATDSPHGTDSNMENSATGSTEPIEMIPRTELSGVVGRVIPLATPARSLPLSDEERKRLWRIARDRANRFMIAAPDVDFLLEIVERLGR
jgi:hypothetical protein